MTTSRSRKKTGLTVIEIGPKCGQDGPLTCFFLKFRFVPLVSFGFGFSPLTRVALMAVFHQVRQGIQKRLLVLC
jgi:hypothetical protein